MANFIGTTASSGGFKPADREGFLAWLEGFDFRMEDINVGLDEDGNFFLYAYDWLDVVRNTFTPEEEAKLRADNGLGPDDDIEDYKHDALMDREGDLGDFTNGIQQFMADGDKFTIHCVGSEKCRFPLSAMEIIVTKNGVKYNMFEVC